MSRTHLAVGVAGVLAGCAAAAALVWGGYPTSPATLVAAVLLSLGVGWSFVFVGLAATVARPDSRVGWLMVLAGFAGLARAVAAVDTRLAFVLGIAVEDVVYAMAAHLLVAFPGGRLRTATDKAVIGFTYALTAPFGLLVYFTLSGDSDCSSCRENIAVPRHGGGELSPIALFIHPAVIVVCVVVLWLMHRRWQRATPALRRSLTPALLGGALFIATIAVQRIGILLTPPEAVRVVLGWASHVALIFFPLGLLTGLVRSRLDRSGVADLAVAMSGAAGPQALRAALARALHDPSLQVGYWLPDRQAFVDDAGAPLDLAQRTARSMTVLQRDGEPVAALLHDESVAEQRTLLEAVAATAGLAVENERLHAAVRAQLAEVSASRARIVAAGDAERRRLERNLHDGAQQSLLSVLLALRLVKVQLDNRDNAAAEASLDEACRVLGQALEEVRELARGIHPAVLTDAGLAAALRSLAERSPVPVTLAEVPAARLPPSVEETAYYVVAESLTNVAKHAGAHTAVVQVAQDVGLLRVEVRDDGVGGADVGSGSGLRGLTDRVSAVGGQLEVHSRPGSGTRIVAEVPCAS
jgi:signal transduction histidine kinase